MIMWELMIGRMPFQDQNNDIELIIKICRNFRPPIIKNAPKGYIELMQKCWDSDPNKMPTAFNIREKLINIERDEEENPTEIIKLPVMPIKNLNNIYKSIPLNSITKAMSTRSLSLGN